MEGLLLPSECYENGKEMYDLKLLSAGGKRNFNTGEIIRRYDQDKALSMLADFILIGNAGNVGSFAMTREKTNIFTTAMTGFVDSVVSVVNRHAIPRLLTLNGWRIDNQPMLTHGGVKSVDLTALGDYLTKLSTSGMELFPNDGLENHLMKVANLPYEEA